MCKIVFITRLTKNSGQGHFFRIIRMIEALALTHECIFVVNKAPLSMDYNVKFHQLNEIHPEIFVKELQLNSKDILWFDLPHYDYPILKNFVDLNNIIISTNMFEYMGEVRYENIAIYPVFEQYKKKHINNKTVQYSGADFITLPEEFFYQEKEEKTASVLVSMGGSDPMGFTALVLRAIAQIKPTSSFSYQVILPEGYCLNDFNELYNDYRHIKLFKFNQLDFASALKNAQYAIINGGMTRYECIAAHTYFIALSLHEKQAELTDKVTKYGLGHNFGVFNEKEIARLTAYLSKIPLDFRMANISSKAPKLRMNNQRWIMNNIIRKLNDENE